MITQSLGLAVGLSPNLGQDTDDSIKPILQYMVSEDSDQLISEDGEDLITQQSIPTPPVLYITANPTSIYEGQDVIFTATASGGSGIKSYLWDFKDTQTSTQQNPTHTFNTANTYSVDCTVTDNDNLTTTKSITIIVSI